MQEASRRVPGQAAVQFAVALPLFLLVVLGVLQFGLWYHAQSVVLAATREGAHVAAREDAPPGSGTEAAGALLGAGLGQLGAEVQIEEAADEEVAVVAASGWLRPIVPLGGFGDGLPLRARAVDFRERFRP